MYTKQALIYAGALSEERPDAFVRALIVPRDDHFLSRERTPQLPCPKQWFEGRVDTRLRRAQRQPDGGRVGAGPGSADLLADSFPDEPGEAYEFGDFGQLG